MADTVGDARFTGDSASGDVNPKGRGTSRAEVTTERVALAREPRARHGAEEHERPVRWYPPIADHWIPGLTRAGVQPNGVRLILDF